MIWKHYLETTAALITTLGLLSLSCTSSDPDKGHPDYSAFLAASEFVPGVNRFPFGLLSTSGESLDNAQVQVEFFLLQRDSVKQRTSVSATFRPLQGVTPHLHLDGTLHSHDDTRGFYAVDGVQFDAPGVWEARFTTTTATGQRVRVQPLAFAVQDTSPIPSVGDSVPASQNLTSRDVAHLTEITTHEPPVLEFYQLTVADALEHGRPFVVVFSTPQFCISRMCGPVTDVAAALHKRYADRLAFIHIEPFDLAVARSEGRLVPTEVPIRWGLRTEPWVFLIGRDGQVTARFEGPVTEEELERALQVLLVPS